MSNREKYDAAFMEVFEIDHDKLNSSLEYQSITAWDSVGHMALVAALEEVFDIMLDMYDIIDSGSYETGIQRFLAQQTSCFRLANCNGDG